MKIRRQTVLDLNDEGLVALLAFALGVSLEQLTWDSSYAHRLTIEHGDAAEAASFNPPNLEEGD